jgi:beta-glucanase (GH16 family)
MIKMKLYKHFDFSNEKSLDLSLWNIEVGKKWANNELQHYVDSDENLYFDNGLVINATLKNGIYESTRINTKNKFFFKYGRIDVVAKVPKGIGTWPAIWMLSKNINEDGAYWDNQGFGTVNWPTCGEIDILEHWGKNKNYVSSAVHNGSSYGYKVENLGGQNVSNASDQFHEYELDYEMTSH